MPNLLDRHLGVKLELLCPPNAQKKYMTLVKGAVRRGRDYNGWDNEGINEDHLCEKAFRYLILRYFTLKPCYQAGKTPKIIVSFRDYLIVQRFGGFHITGKPVR